MSTNNKKQKPWKIKSEAGHKASSSSKKSPAKKKKSTKKSFGKKLTSALLIIVGVLLLAGVCSAGYFYYMISKEPEQNNDNSHLTDKQDMFENTQKENEADDSSKISRKEGFYNILVIGRDKVALNTDVIIAASFDTKAGKAATVQIPRDSYVSDEDGNTSKINAVFARGYTESRSELLRLKNAAKGKSEQELVALCEASSIDIDEETLSRYMNGKIAQDKLCTKYGIKKLQSVIGSTFGIYFDYYAIVSTDAFVKIVDAIGGVDIYVQEDMKYHDPLQNLHIDIKAGQQHLNGKQAEGFVRYRSGYVQADIARLDAQKIFLTAFFKKALSVSTLGRIDEVVKAAFECVDTDMTFENALGFVKPALSLDLSNIKMMNMLGYAYNGGMYYSLDKKANLAIVNEHFNIFDRALSESAVNVVELVAPPADGKTGGGMTMEDISEHQPSLGFIHQLPPKVDTPVTPETTDPSVTTAPEASENEVTDPATTEGGKNDGDKSGEDSDGEDSSENGETASDIEGPDPETEPEAPSEEDVPVSAEPSDNKNITETENNTETQTPEESDVPEETDNSETVTENTESTESENVAVTEEASSDEV